MSVCPICGSDSGELPRTGDAEGFGCHQHGRFKVSDSALRSEPSKSASRSSWESALDKAKGRVRPDEVPTITTYDF